MRHLPPPPFVVPPELTANIRDRKPDQKRPGRPRQYSDGQRQRAIHKSKLKMRHGPRIDQSIASLEYRLELLREIRDELNEG